MIFQQIIVVSSRIVLQVLGLSNKYLRLHQASRDCQIASCPLDNPSVLPRDDKGNAVLITSLVRPESPRTSGQSFSEGGSMPRMDVTGELQIQGSSSLMWMLRSEDSAGIGGLIRSHPGQVRIAFTRRLMHSPFLEHAETVAIQEGLRLAQRFSFFVFTVQSDCRGVIDQLKSRLAVLGSLGYIHSQIFSQVDRLNISLSFVRHSDNVRFFCHFV